MNKAAETDEVRNSSWDFRGSVVVGLCCFVTVLLLLLLSLLVTGIAVNIGASILGRIGAALIIAAVAAVVWLVLDRVTPGSTRISKLIAHPFLTAFILYLASALWSANQMGWILSQGRLFSMLFTIGILLMPVLVGLIAGAIASGFLTRRHKQSDGSASSH